MSITVSSPGFGSQRKVVVTIRIVWYQHTHAVALKRRLANWSVDVKLIRLGPGPRLRNQCNEDYVGVFFFAQRGVWWERREVGTEGTYSKIRTK